MLGALVVEYKGNKLGVGSGFTDQQRQHIWDWKGHYISKQVEIETFGESKNAMGEVSLNCPIFKRFVGEEE
jgi:DNA ligase-1